MDFFRSDGVGFEPDFYPRYGTLLLRRILVVLAIIPAMVLLAAQWQDKIIGDQILQPHGWGTVWTFLFWTALFLLYFGICLVTSIGVLGRFIRTTPWPSQRKQGQFIFGATLFVFCLGVLTDVAVPMAGFYSVPPIADVLMLLWAASLTCAILRYHLMTISPATAAENIISSMSDLLILTDIQLRVTTVNAATAACLGYSRKEMRTWPKFIMAGRERRAKLPSQHGTWQALLGSVDLENAIRSTTSRDDIQFPFGGSRWSESGLGGCGQGYQRTRTVRC
jgi:PAS domain-containing protein